MPFKGIISCSLVISSNSPPPITFSLLMSRSPCASLSFLNLSRSFNPSLSLTFFSSFYVSLLIFSPPVSPSLSAAWSDIVTFLLRDQLAASWWGAAVGSSGGGVWGECCSPGLCLYSLGEIVGRWVKHTTHWGELAAPYLLSLAAQLY